MKRKILSLLLCLSLFVSALVPVGFVAAQTGVTAKITVNYVYEKDNAMVAQPYSATVPTGQSFQTKLALPKPLNYSITAESAAALPNGVSLDSENNHLNINLQSVNEDVNMALYYRAGTAEYTVTSWKQKLRSEEYELISTVKLTGDIDAYTNAKADQMDGFSSRVEQGIIAADGSTEISIYYDRLSYTVVFDPNGGVNASDPIYAEYGTTFEESYVKEPTQAGYVFKGWSPAVEYTITESITYVAQWEKESDTADYTIVIWGQNANDDDYAYLNSYPAYGKTDTEVAWNEDTYICPGAHEHNENCFELTCGQEEHTHQQDCIGCDKEEHTHSAACCSKEEHTHGLTCLWGVLCEKTEHTHGDGSCNTENCGNKPEHIHGESCYTCGKTAHMHTETCYELTCELEGHTHTAACKMGLLHPDRDLWAYEKSETVAITADGKAVLNVYFTRKAFTLTFRDGRNTVYTITERWGKNISRHWPIHGTNGTVYGSGERWKPSGSSTYNQVLVFIEIMPAESFTLTVDRANYDQYVMHYYVEVLDGQGEREYGGKFFTQAFAVTANYNYVTEAEDFFDLEGYTQWKSDPEFQRGEIDIDGGGDVYFYYIRNSFTLKFFSGNNSTSVKTVPVKYQENLAQYDWTPSTPPADMESDAKFVGWYLNPQCTGEKYVFSEHNMPANDVALYAKWVNGLYTVKTFVNDSMDTPYTYEGYQGVEENIIKYTLAHAPKDPMKSGEVFVGWFYQDENGSEKPFSFTMPITRDYNLYPKFSNEEFVPYIVHYYIEGTTTKLAEDETREARIGSSVTEKAKMGNELALAPEGTLYFPLQTSTSVVLTEANQEIFFYYKPAAETEYTVQYVDANGKLLRESKTVITSDSVVTESYVEIPGYMPRQYQQSLELSAEADKNVIVFVYDPANTELKIWKQGANTTLDPDANFVFHIKGTEASTSAIDLTVTIRGNGHIKITDLPIGRYTVEETEWSWRYTPEKISQEITLAAGGNNQLTFQNSRTDDQWLDGEDSCVNEFTGKQE